MDRNPDHWQARLPENLLASVVWPVRVESHHDDEVPAAKWRGYDDHPVLQLLREEDFEAWRSLAGPWIRRVQRLDGDGRPCGVLEDSGFELVPASDLPRL